MDRGFVYVIAHIRGGQEMGRHWYEDGRLMNKMNTFTDFIDVTKALQQSRIIDPARTYAMGGSAGGLLMGAVVNMAPELYHGVVAAVPFVDVVTTMLDETIPLTTGEFNEWGNPKDKDAYEYMLSYSPYDQVSAQDYPNIMVTTGLHDSQVQYFEPAKWVARLRDRRTDNNKLIMHTNMDAGHGGASGRYRRYEETAQEYAFLAGFGWIGALMFFGLGIRVQYQPIGISASRYLSWRWFMLLIYKLIIVFVVLFFLIACNDSSDCTGGIQLRHRRTDQVTPARGALKNLRLFLKPSGLEKSLSDIEGQDGCQDICGTLDG